MFWCFWKIRMCSKQLLTQIQSPSLLIITTPNYHADRVRSSNWTNIDQPRAWDSWTCSEIRFTHPRKINSLVQCTCMYLQKVMSCNLAESIFSIGKKHNKRIIVTKVPKMLSRLKRSIYLQKDSSIFEGGWNLILENTSIRAPVWFHTDELNYQWIKL